MSVQPFDYPITVSTRADFAAALTALRERAGLTVRELARRLDTSPSTLGGYFSGRHVPSLSQSDLLRRLVAECGVTDEDAQDDWLDAARRARGERPTERRGERPAERPAPPYLGLRAFQAEDAELFLGREAETEQVLGLLASRRVVAVLGPSGSGKSSLVRAGVAAAIRAGRLPGASRCEIVTPSTWPDPGATFSDADVVVVDQFEEIFTGAADAAADALATVIDPPAGTRVVLGMRADFYAVAAAQPALLAVLQDAQVLLGPIPAEHLRAVITRPAESVGAVVEPGLVDLLLADLRPRDTRSAAHDQGALPLLAHALLATWEHSSGATMTVEDYRASGGLHGAIARTAEDVYESLDDAGRADARRLFLRLVNTDGEIALTRRRTSWTETGAFAHVIDPFVASRLITSGTDSVEISHEALLGAWPRLRQWIDEDRAGLRLLRQVGEGTTAWEQAERDDELLLRGTRLLAVREWMADGDHAADLDARERAFVARSVECDDVERRRARRRARRLRQLLAAVAVLALVATGLAAYALHARSAARASAAGARIARDEALSRDVAEQARSILDSDPALAEQLALVAYRIDPSDDARAVVLQESSLPPITRVLGALGPTPLAVSPDGRRYAVGHADDGSVSVYAAGRRPRLLGRLREPGGGQVFALAFSHDGRTLAAGGQSAAIRLWDVTDPAHPMITATVPHGFDGAVQTIVFSPDDRSLLAGSAGAQPVHVWSLAVPSRPAALPAPAGIPAGSTVQSLAFSPDGSRLAAGAIATPHGLVLCWPADRFDTAGPAIAHVAPESVYAVAFSHDGRLVYAGDSDGQVTVHDAYTMQPAPDPFERTGAGKVTALAVSPDGSRIAVGSGDDTVAEYATDSGQQLGSTGNPGPVTGVAYPAGTADLVTTAADGALRIQPYQHGVTTDGTVFNMNFSADGSRLLLDNGGAHRGLRLYDTHDIDDPRRLGPLLDGPGGDAALNDGTGALRPDGRLAAGGGLDGSVTLWDVTDGAHPRLTASLKCISGGHLVESISFSPDGHWLAVGGDDDTVRVLDVRRPGAPRIVATERAKDLVLGVAFSPNGRLLAVASADRHVYLWDVATPTRPTRRAAIEVSKTYVYGVTFSPDSRRLAEVSADHTARIYDVRNPARPVAVGAPLIGSTDYLYNAGFSPDGRQLVVASNDRTVRIYDVSGTPDPVPVAALGPEPGVVFTATFTPDGRRVLAAGRFAQAAVFDVNRLADYARTACGLFGDPITRQEWSLYVRGAPYHPPCS